MDIDEPDEPTEGIPLIETPSHVYMILPVDSWSAAAAFVAANVSPEAPFPNDPEESSVMVAINRSTLEIEGVLCAMKRIVVDHFACRPQSGVAYSSFHQLLQAALPIGTVYYTIVADTVGGLNAAHRSGLNPKMRAALTVIRAGEGVEGSDAVDSVGSSGSQRTR